MRRFALPVVLVALLVALGTTTGFTASAAPQRQASQLTTSVSLTGEILGGAKKVEIGMPLSFMWTLTNTGTTAVDDCIIVTSLTHVSGEHNAVVLPGKYREVASNGWPSLNTCDYLGTTYAGQRLEQLVAGVKSGSTTTVSASAKACVENSKTGVVIGPCVTLSVEGI